MKKDKGENKDILSDPINIKGGGVAISAAAALALGDNANFWEYVKHTALLAFFVLLIFAVGAGVTSAVVPKGEDTPPLLWWFKLVLAWSGLLVVFYLIATRTLT